MDTHTYPGSGLSLSQLVFALKKELKRVAYSPSFTLDAISQLDQDTTTALKTIREWRNTFAPVNRIPLDVLSLVPIHLPSQGDRFRATFVCRHWRRTFLQHGTLWSQISLKKGEVYTKTLLERVKGSSLDVSIPQDVPVDTITMISPRVQQITCLEFERGCYWEDIGKFVEANPGPLPLLRTLKVSARGNDDDDQPVIPLQNPLFANAVNVEQFDFQPRTLQFLDHFIFPNLTTFSLWAGTVDGSGAPDLFNFLQASPMLRTVKIYSFQGIALEDIPPEMVVVLPNVETFSLTSRGKKVYDVAVHISCPRARDVSLACEVDELEMSLGREVFPTPVLWNAILHQYTRSPVEEATLEVQPFLEPCSLTFRSSDTSAITLGFKLIPCEDMEEHDIDFNKIVSDVFSQGFNTILAHPLLPNIKRLCIRGRGLEEERFRPQLPATEIGKLFERAGPLDQLTIGGCYLSPYFAGFGMLGDMWRPAVFHPIKELKLLHPMIESGHIGQCMGFVVGLAKSQYMRGMPFERVTIRAKILPATMAETLTQWVGVADCCEDPTPES